MSAVETPVCIVLAWTTIETRGAEPWAPAIVVSMLERGMRPDDWQKVQMPHASMWCAAGALAEVAKASAHATKMEPPAHVFVYDVAERIPIERAKREILEIPK